MGKTNPLGHLSPRRDLWPDTLLPFFDWFIRQRGFDVWWGNLTGTRKEREDHPFVWTYDEASKAVEYEDRWIENGREVKQVVTTSLPRALEEILEHHVDLTLSVVRARASRSDRGDSLLIPYLAEVEALGELSDAHPVLSHYPSARAALEKLERGLCLLGSPKLRKPKRTKGGSGLHQQRQPWVVQAYADQRARLPGLSEFDTREEVAAQYEEEFGDSINESTIRRLLGQR